MTSVWNIDDNAIFQQTHERKKSLKKYDNTPVKIVYIDNSNQSPFKFLVEFLDGKQYNVAESELK